MVRGFEESQPQTSAESFAIGHSTLLDVTVGLMVGKETTAMAIGSSRVVTAERRF